MYCLVSTSPFRPVAGTGGGFLLGDQNQGEQSMISRSPAASWKTTFYVHLLAAEVLSARLRSPGTMATVALMGVWSSATRAACLSPCLCISVSLRLSSHMLCSHLLMAVRTVLLERTVTSLHPYFRFLLNVAPFSEVFREVTVRYGCWLVVLKQAKGRYFILISTARTIGFWKW